MYTPYVCKLVVLMYLQFFAQKTRGARPRENIITMKPISQALAPYSYISGCCAVNELVSRALSIGIDVVTGVLGLEPRLTVLETGILPLDDAPICCHSLVALTTIAL